MKLLYPIRWPLIVSSTMTERFFCDRSDGERFAHLWPICHEWRFFLFCFFWLGRGSGGNQTQLSYTRHTSPSPRPSLEKMRLGSFSRRDEEDKAKLIEDSIRSSFLFFFRTLQERVSSSLPSKDLFSRRGVGTRTSYCAHPFKGLSGVLPRTQRSRRFPSGHVSGCPSSGLAGRPMMSDFD